MTLEEEGISSEATRKGLTAEGWMQTALPAAGTDRPFLKGGLVAHRCDCYSPGDIKPTTQPGRARYRGKSACSSGGFLLRSQNKEQPGLSLAAATPFPNLMGQHAGP